MDGIKIEVTGNIARVTEKPSRITSGTVGLPVEFSFDNQWDGLRKIAVFQAGNIKKHMGIVNGVTAVPIEVVEKPGARLNVGVYGEKEDGTIALPTIWVNLGIIHEGAVPTGSAGSDVSIAKKYYEDAWLSSEKAEASAKKAEVEAGVAETSAARAENAANLASGSASSAARSAEDANAASANAQAFANDIEEAAETAVGAAHQAEAILANTIKCTPMELNNEQKTQARSNIGACSFAEVADRLYHKFTVSGPIVSCEPAEGFPLEVVSLLQGDGINPNLLPDAASWEFEDGEPFLYIPELPEGQYTLHTNCYMIPVHLQNRVPAGDMWHTITPITDDGQPEFGVTEENFTFYANPGFAYRLTYVWNSEDYENGYFEKDYSHEEILKLLNLKLESGAEYTSGFTSVKLTQENGTDTRLFTTEFDKAFSGGSFNWSTGVLTDHNGIPHMMASQEIIALPGTNTLYSDTGDTEVSGWTIEEDIATEKAIIDKLCPSFSKSGSIVTCEPVEGYPLEVTAEDGATITRCGKNIFGGDALADALESKDNGNGVTKNEANKTVTFDPGLMTRTGHLFNEFKENTQYTIILYGYQTSAGGATNIRVQYTDETAESLYFGTAGKPNPANEPGYCIHKTNPNKTVWRITPQWVSSTTVLYYDQCGVFEGNVSTAEFEAYRAETFPVGENVPALPGVNTLWANSGDITVTGKADPVAIINKLLASGVATTEE